MQSAKTHVIRFFNSTAFLYVLVVLGLLLTAIFALAYATGGGVIDLLSALLVATLTASYVFEIIQKRKKPRER